MHDRSVIPNPVIDPATEGAPEGEAPLQPPDIDERREAMKTFEGKEPVVRVPVASALTARSDEPASDPGSSDADDADADDDDEDDDDDDQTEDESSAASRSSV